jgi:hypothetical protein
VKAKLKSLRQQVNGSSYMMASLFAENVSNSESNFFCISPIFGPWISTSLIIHHVTNPIDGVD